MMGAPSSITSCAISGVTSTPEPGSVNEGLGYRFTKAHTLVLLTVVGFSISEFAFPTHPVRNTLYQNVSVSQAVQIDVPRHQFP